MSIDAQVAFLLEDTYFADEAGGPPEGGLRTQMATELRAKLELAAKLKAKGDANWPLRVYYGADPTRNSLHIGHMIPVSRMRKFQQLGHQVVFLIGDYTAMIGDPTGQSTERTQLTHDDVMELSRFYTGQAHRLLYPKSRTVAYPGGSIGELAVEVRYNGEWLAGLGFTELAHIAAQFSLSQIAARKDFRERIEAGGFVGLHESFYALMQGYDAFALNCDVQVGGYDQHLNLLAGRDLQRYFERKHKGVEHPLYPGQRVKGPHVMLTYPLLMGTDGRKMSKSWGNTIDVLDTPDDMFGKVMRISDEMIAHYIDVAIDARTTEKHLWKIRAADEPMAVKKWIAAKITAMYNGEEAAAKAEEHFRKTVQEKTVDPGDVPEVRVPDAYRAEHLGLGPVGVKQEGTIDAVAQVSVPVQDSVHAKPSIDSVIEDFRSYRRNLPHWRLSGSVCFLTWRLHQTHPELNEAARDIVVSALKHFDNERYHLVGLVVMDDHVHVIVKPILSHELSALTYTWKSFTANRIQREVGLQGAIWQDESWDRIVRDEDELLEKAQYMLSNPAKRWPGINEYKWVYLNLPAASESYTGTETCATSLDATSSQAPKESDADNLQAELQPRLVDLIVELQLAASKSEARRLLTQGGVKLDDAVVTDPFTPYIHVAPTLLQVGKRKFVRLV